jgi:hypothetical protein
LRLGQGDLRLCHAGAPDGKIFQFRLGFGRDPLGLGLGTGDDRLRLALRLLLLASIFRNELLGLVAQAAGLVELGLDARPPLIERIDELLVNVEIDEAREENDERDGDPVPISRSTMAAAASAAIARTLAMAATLVAAIAASASASLALSSPSSALRRSSASAVNRLWVSAAMVWARPRASAINLS